MKSDSLSQLPGGSAAPSDDVNDAVEDALFLASSSPRDESVSPLRLDKGLLDRL